MQRISAHSQIRPLRRPQADFSRPELKRILDVYGRYVAAGAWRDYAIDHGGDSACFSIYRSTHETPLFTIEKRRDRSARSGDGSGDGWLYVLADRRKIIKSAARLADVLERLHNMPRLVK